ncbi:PTS fructose transporter subunit IIA [Actinopolyspora erythraea]|uniref:PTS fructose transporter subunit IIA n=1 Tax=Actinopolyspora erythraea TaxID=414996 RepID=A0A099D7C6_9ACTN|nr:fructose PTS transporter subunit IIA [Actinopolyspora erythraea]ASU78304.1 PTS fructose transporter subunit IIA [Actinopolyspora erythraea]KGI82003.1 PTS fructose transporter subunit IIA [Actinopolyspora erythraea]
MSSELIIPELVDLDLPGEDRRSAVRSLADRLVSAERVTDVERFLDDVEARERQMPTGMRGGIGIPHCRSATVTVPSLAFGRSSGGIDFGAEDGPANLVFLIAAPEGGDSDHIAVLAALARRLVRAEFKQALLDANDPASVASYVREEVKP